MNEFFKNVLEKDSGIYSATNEDGVEVMVFREKGHGFDVWTPTHNGWYEVVSYDENGNQECVTYKND